jgi:hypothetical protein
MAKPVIAVGKKRYSLTLTQAKVERFQTLLKQTGMAGSMSSLCDQALESTSDQLQIFRDNGTIKISDLFNLIGQQMDLMEDERGKTGEQKREKTSISSKGVKCGN